MYDKGKIITGVVIGLLLLTFPLIYLAASGDGGYVPELQPAEKGTQCIESDEFMRENHMLLLDDWRLSVVRGGNRVYIASDGQEYYMGLANPTNPEELPLQTGACLACHTDKDEFCDTCHSYSGAEPGCWDCHVSGEE